MTQLSVGPTDEPRRSPTDVAIAVILGAAGVIHLIPWVGVLGADALESLYGIDASDPDIEVLLRHRAVLFAILGAATITAAITRRHRTALLLVNFVSVTTFSLVALLEPATSSQIDRVAVIDLVLSAVIAAGLVLSTRSRRAGESLSTTPFDSSPSDHPSRRRGPSIR